MALIELNGIGKIYVSDKSVAVGIRGVSLSFDRGEFVAVTGKSGSGKSTLLNVISGMDTYEEGELLIDGETTSHYQQSDWEEYREKYISFIFQDYNIIDSFTVLENVELALMHIENKRERRKRALELIERVGLTSHINHKGSHLSGGQKQRTVIARALAKDSPIILADEPTGNLDAATSKQIIELLYEVSRDKLLIVVTHSFDEVKDYATRHVRIFDGAVESDTILSKPEFCEAKMPKNEKKTASHPLKNGISLGVTIFKSKPRLSLFLSLLMTVGAIAIFVITSLCTNATEAFSKKYMFEHISGRVVLVKDSGEPITDAELDSIKEKYGAQDYVHYDLLLDAENYAYVSYDTDDGEQTTYVSMRYGEYYGDRVIGRYPNAENEVLLYLPVSYKPIFGSKELKIKSLKFSGVEYDLVGVGYYYDNNQKCKCLFTKEGFEVASAIYTVFNSSGISLSVNVTDEKGNAMQASIGGIAADFGTPAGGIYLNESYIEGTATAMKNAYGSQSINISATLISRYYNYDYGYSGGYYAPVVFKRTYEGDTLLSGKPILGYAPSYVLINPIELADIMKETFSVNYRQASVFFADDKAANEASELLCDAGYIAVPSYTTYDVGGEEMIISMISGIVIIALWLLAVLFIAFFIHLCTSRVIGAFRGELSIMRSMGIPVSAIRISILVRMLLALIPAFISVIALAILIFTSSAINATFTYLYPWQYALIFAGMIILTLKVTHAQIRRLFSKSVKVSLREEGVR